LPADPFGPMLETAVKRFSALFTVAAALSGGALSLPASNPDRPSGAESAAETRVPAEIRTLLDNHCINCHGPRKKEGSVRFDQLAALGDEEFAGLAVKVRSALELREMPPEGGKPLSPADHSRMLEWSRRHGRAGPGAPDEDKLRLPRLGNVVDHDLLFSGQVREKAFTQSRRWLVSPQIFRERVIDVFGLEGREREIAGRNLFGVTNPFVLPDRSGVRDYDLTVLDGGHLLVMLGNADWISGKQIRAARVRSGELKADVFENPQDRWHPKTTPAAFETIILKKSAPTDAEMTAAVRTQFESVLRRPPAEAELKAYLSLLQQSISVAGNAEGLRLMLKTVLLESEFLYRLELGAGSADEFGRRKLAPREAAFAIAYALGDRGPDPALEKAAGEGRLETREDYRREVTRLLADQTWFRGPIDPALEGKHIRSHVTAHPKIIRFFREFFGYPAALRVFKDPHRSGGYYENPDRGHLGTPGWLVNEADEQVKWCVEQDRRVFENLLTTDRFFVYHNMDAESGRQLVARWRGAYEKLKGEPWKTAPEKVMSAHRDLLVSAKVIDGREKELWRQKREFLSYMHYFQDTFGQGRTPFTRGPFTHGYSYHHSTSYNLPTLPTRFRYLGVETKNFKAPKEFPQYWDYPVEQPFVIEGRKGILTHPAWLIAHSQNSETDPVRRGLWVREKLLAGRVPDVPITVDARIPEDPHKTLRERLDAATDKQECLRCHRFMNPLGVTFELFDDFGRRRTVESLEHPENLIAKAKVKDGADTFKTKPVNTTGRLTGTADPALDGDVSDALDLIDRLARSARVRQSIIRHAFRFHLGRNETLADAKTLIDADRAYVESGGSFKAVIVSLLTSDSFLYRK